MPVQRATNDDGGAFESFESLESPLPALAVALAVSVAVAVAETELAMGFAAAAILMTMYCRVAGSKR